MLVFQITEGCTGLCRFHQGVYYFFISGQIFYSSMMPSGTAHAGMYMYSYSLRSLKGVTR